MRTIYKYEKGKEEILNLYDSQLSRLTTPWKDVYVDTSFEKTLVKVWNRNNMDLSCNPSYSSFNDNQEVKI